MEHFDVLIVGAGISGIGAAYHLQTYCPGRSYAILEGREALGGTWDLFRYPGIRSDSDMFTLGFSFKPWMERKAIADGPSIMRYLHETVKENQIDKHIRYSQWVSNASWSTEDAIWTIKGQHKDTSEELKYTCNFLFVCGGYYDYDEGYTPDFPGRERFKGRIVHPQKWTDDVEYEDKRVVVIGSGATAVTLVPTMADKAAHVTMLQRSPTYMISRPSEDAIANRLQRHLPAMVAYNMTRWKNVAITMYFYNYSKSKPKKAARFLIDSVKKELRGDFDVDKHFTPKYKPWDQRVCLVPDGDLFQAINDNKASVVTDEIDTFVENGLLLKSGQILEADLIVTATGLKLKMMGGIQISVDGQKIKTSDCMTYKAMMFSDIPNLALSFGYTNASWTLKCDLSSEYICRLLNHMDKKGYRKCVPRITDERFSDIPFVGLQSGYIKRGQHLLPRQGSKAPWRLKENYAKDIATIRYCRVDDGVMEFR